MGCGLLLGLGPSLLGCHAGAQPAVTYSEHVAPLLRQSCVACHRPGGSAPFSLLTYEDVSARAERIVDATSRGTMPPWLPRSGGELFGERRLSADQIALLERWVGEGSLRGEASSSDPSPSEWQLGDPDLVVAFPSYVLQPSERDSYRKLVVRVPVDAPRYVSAVELRPSNPGAVHHLAMGVDTTRSSHDLDMRDDGPGFDGMTMEGNASHPDGHLVGWTPGSIALPPVEGLAWRMEPGMDLVLQMHLPPTATPVRIDVAAGFHFTTNRSEVQPVCFVLESTSIDIPAGDPDHRVTASYTLPVDVDLLSVYPHAHYLGKRLFAQARTPDGATRRLIDIPRWDFDFQEEYRYRRPVSLLRGSVIELDFTFDNSADNPDNPSQPPRRVTYGLESADEMAQIILQLLPRSLADRERLVADIAEHHRAQSMTYLAEVERQQGDAWLAAGAADSAIVHYRRAMGYRLDHPRALIGLTLAFTQKADFASAYVAGSRSVEATRGRDVDALLALAEAYFAGGDGRATAVALQAARVARASGDVERADSIEAHLVDR